MKDRRERDPRYFWFAVAEVIRKLSVYVEEADFSDKDLAIQYTKQIVGLLTEISREIVKSGYDERVWVPVYKFLMEFSAKTPYKDVISNLVKLRDRLYAMLEDVMAKSEKV